MPSPRLFTRESLNSTDRTKFRPYRKKNVTWMMKVQGPFKVVTQHGVVECDDGWVAIDDEGWPYPVAGTVFEKSYEPE